MRNDDMFRESIKNKKNLIPDSYSQRISDLLDSLPDEMPDSGDTEAAVISRKPRIINIRALVSAAAAFAVVFAAVISVSQMQKPAFDKNRDDEGKRYAVTTVTVTEVSETTQETNVTLSETVVSEKSLHVPAEAGVTTLIQGEKKTDAENTAVYPVVTKVAEKTAPPVSGVTLPAHTAPVIPAVTEPERFPDRPDIPGNPNNPDNPGDPNNPNIPNIPNKPDNPYAPGYPDNPDRPDNSGHENGNKIPFVTEPDDREDRPGYGRDEDWYDEHYKDNGRNDFEGYDDFSDIKDEYEKIKKETEEEIESEKEKAENIIREYEEQ